LNKPKNIKKSVSDDSAESLIQACLTNDRKAQIALYKRYAKSMFNVSLRMVKDKMLAEDIMQEAFISAFKGLKNFRKEVTIYSWLRKIVINKSIDEIRRQKVKFTEINEELISEELTENDEYTNKEEMLKQLKNELFNLPDRYRIILSLYYLEGYDHEEISQILNISSSTSRSQLTRAKKLLSKRMTTD
jgi:RNA polymerase sigma factor (sigma-70 family)